MPPSPNPLESLLRDLVQLLERSRELARKPPEEPRRQALLQRAERHVAQALSDVAACMGTTAERSDKSRRLAGTIAKLRERNGGPPTPGPPKSKALHAQSTQVTLTDILDQLAEHRTTGILRVHHSGSITTFHMHRGALIGATESRPADDCRLERILEEQGAVDRDRIRAVLAQRKAPTTDLVSALVAYRVVDEEQMRAAVTLRIGRLLERALAAERAEYSFHTGRLEQASTPVRLSAEQALDAARAAAPRDDAADVEDVDDMESLRRQLRGLKDDREPPKLRTRPKR